MGSLSPSPLELLLDELDAELLLELLELLLDDELLDDELLEEELEDAEVLELLLESSLESAKPGFPGVPLPPPPSPQASNELARNPANNSRSIKKSFIPSARGFMSLKHLPDADVAQGGAVADKRMTRGKIPVSYQLLSTLEPLI